MKKNFKKSLSLFLAVLMTMSCFAVTGFAAEADYGAHNAHRDKVVVLPEEAATECKDGKTAGLKCTQCNQVIKAQEPIFAPHNFNAWTSEKTDDCTKGYKMSRTCQNAGCTKKEEKTINKHSWGDDQEVGWAWEKDPATCTVSADKIRTCSVCTTVERKTIEATGHKYYTAVASSKPTCEKEGAEAKRECRVCHEVDPDASGRTFDKLPHEDLDGDSYCDNGCGGYIGSDGETCDCPCHQSSGVLSTLWKIVLFIFRLFKIGQNCGCGALHYEA